VTERSADNPALGGTLNQLGLMLAFSKDYIKAEPFLRRACTIAEKTWGAISEKLGACLNNLGLLSFREHNYEGAAALFQRALLIQTKASGNGSHPVAVELLNLANVWQAQGALVCAESYYTSALQIDESVLGPTHPDTLRDWAKLHSVWNRGAWLEP
jgi:tetratricopeptide (TPR) repeat protein